ncbi:hypothetical protein Agub_g1994, partial [Astrephomene gubernaculifera]
GEVSELEAARQQWEQERRQMQQEVRVGDWGVGVGIGGLGRGGGGREWDAGGRAEREAGRYRYACVCVAQCGSAQSVLCRWWRSPPCCPASQPDTPSNPQPQRPCLPSLPAHHLPPAGPSLLLPPPHPSSIPPYPTCTPPPSSLVASSIFLSFTHPSPHTTTTPQIARLKADLVTERHVKNDVFERLLRLEQQQPPCAAAGGGKAATSLLYNKAGLTPWQADILSRRYEELQSRQQAVLQENAALRRTLTSLRSLAPDLVQALEFPLLPLQHPRPQQEG